MCTIYLYKTLRRSNTLYMKGIKLNDHELNPLCLLKRCNSSATRLDGKLNTFSLHLICQVAFEKMCRSFSLYERLLSDHLLLLCEAGTLKVSAKFQCLHCERTEPDKKKKKKKSHQTTKIKHCLQWRYNHSVVAFVHRVCVCARECTARTHIFEEHNADKRV